MGDLDMNRRQFLGASAAAVLVAGTMAKGKVFGANDRIRTATIGVRSRGFDHVKAVTKRDDAEIVALCDVDSDVLASQANALKGLSGKDPKTYGDIRELLADGDIDAVTIAAPNHWHVLAAIWALQAGKHVYIEKPMSHTVFEGRQLVAAAEKYGKVLQHGTQRRSEPPHQRIAGRAKSGVIGNIYMAKCFVYRLRDPFSFPPSETPPPSLDWTLWQGPAPEKPFSRNYVHYNWHWFWHYGNGEIGNNGPHRTDIANWILDKGLPVETYATGGIFGYLDDARETPNTQMVTHTFADGAIFTIDVRNRYSDQPPADAFYGTEGYMINGRFFDKDDKEILDDQKPDEKASEGDSTDLHFANFFDAIKKGDPKAVNATAEQGHVAAALCHLGNISYLVKRAIRFDPKTETITGDDEANALLTRTYREGFEVPTLA